MDTNVPWMTFSDFERLKFEKDNFSPVLTNPPVLYDDPQHRYHYKNQTYTSATQLLDKFKHKFDVQERSEYMAHRYSQSPEYWQQKWGGIRDASLERGNEIHNRREQALYEKGVSIERNKSYKVLKGTDYSDRNYIYLPDGIYPELLVWNHPWRIAGRVDKIIINTIEHKVTYGNRVHWTYARIADVEDYKTNKVIYRESFKDKDGYRMMTGPLSHLMDCHYTHYSLQLSIYQYMLEMMGFVPGNRRIIHIKHEIEGLGIPEPEVIEVPYLRTEVIAMLNHHKNASKYNKRSSGI